MSTSQKSLPRNMETAEFNIVQGHLSLAPDKTHSPTALSVDLTPIASQDTELTVKTLCMQSWWESTVSKELEIPYKYTSVGCLIVRWADYLDRDLDCGAESEDLNKLFVEGFNYKSTVLTLDDKRSPKVQLRSGIDKLILEHDGPCRSHLLIVYYTGHGVGSEGAGLDITGVRDARLSAINPRFEPSANWNKAEKCLKDAEADVLTILDCCCAGNIMKGSTEDIRTFEVLAATGKKMVTEPPGKRSFTRAMIGALEDQLQKPEQAPFTTFALNEEIMRRRDNNHRSHLFSRHPTSSHRFIKLAPLEAHKTPETPASAQEASYLTIRFSFKDVTLLQEKQVVRLAKEVSQGAVASNLGINRVDWIDFQQSKGGERWAEFMQLLRGVRRAQRCWRLLVQSRGLKRKRDPEANDDYALTAKRLEPATGTAMASISSIISPPRSVRSNASSSP